jgi:hypothetical protein
MDAAELVQRLHEQRLTTMALADQIKEDRWRDPILPGGRTLHDLLAHLVAWDEWAYAVFDISRVRDELPPVLLNAPRDADAYDARHEKRMRNLTRDDILGTLQAGHGQLLKGAMAAGGAEWAERCFPDLAAALPPRGDAPAIAGEPPKGPSVGSILAGLLDHEAAHDRELMAAFGIEPHLERFGKPADDSPEGEE